MTSRLAALLLLLGAAAARKPSKPDVKAPALGNVVEWSAPDFSYLAGYQIVGIIEPGSTHHRVLDRKTKRFTTQTTKAAIRWRIKKQSRFRFGRSKAPFKMRIVDYNADAGLAEAEAKGRVVHDSDEKTNEDTIVLLKPEPWWKRLL